MRREQLEIFLCGLPANMGHEQRAELQRLASKIATAELSERINESKGLNGERSLRPSYPASHSESV
jgi:hypothetical protein